MMLRRTTRSIVRQPQLSDWVVKLIGLFVVDNNPGGYECPTHLFHW